jgi:LacI family transcriptional regulator
MVSYGIMDAILKKGYLIPDDFSVCGFDNDFASSLLPISLTTVEHYMEDKGKKAFDMIYEKIQEKDDFFVQDDKCVIRIEYKSKLISRDSTNVARTRKNINL